MPSASFKYGVLLVNSMSVLVYHVVLSHSDKGVAFNAKTALNNTANKGFSPLVGHANLIDPASDKTTIEIRVNPDHQDLTKSIEDLINQALESSGRVSKKADYDVESITFIREDLAPGAPAAVPAGDERRHLFEQISVLRAQLSSAQTQMAEREKEVNLLNSRLEERKYAGVSDPVTGVLSFFSNNLASAVPSISDTALNADFALKVLNSDLSNTLPAYIRHITGTKLDDGKIQEILDADLSQLDGSRVAYEKGIIVMQEELTALEKVMKGQISLPERVKALIIKDITDKHYEEEIKKIRDNTANIDETKSQRIEFDKYRKQYSDLSENIYLIQESVSKLNILFVHRDEGMDIYFPISVRGATVNVLDELKKHFWAGIDTATAGTSITHSNVKLDVLPHDRFVAYRLEVDSVSPSDKAGLFDSFVQESTKSVPSTLKLAGYIQFCPYRIGI